MLDKSRPFGQLVVFLLTAVVLCCSVLPVTAQNLRAGTRPGPHHFKSKPLKGKITHALQINYPLSFFDGTRTGDWRSTGTLNRILRDDLEEDNSWKKHSKAQDQEDIWLLENWFYGIENGIIMESGALDGISYSTSYLFEHVANWTAIHVGKIQSDFRLY